MDQSITPNQMLAALKQDVIDHPSHMRWAHTHGLGVRGRFIASDVARDFCVASHFQGDSVEVTARFSNSSSEKERHDEWPDVRGLAVKFHLTEGEEHDLLMMTLGVFGARTRAEFVEGTKAFVPKPVEPVSWFRRHILNPLMLRATPAPLPEGVTMSGGPGLAHYAGSHAFARAFTIQRGLSQVPISWARTAYHAVHTFFIVDAAGVRRAVRFSWQPVDGVFPVPAEDLPSRASHFLTKEMRKRLAVEPSRFTLKMMIGETGDDWNDPSTLWPVTRQTINMGTLFIDALAEDQNKVERMSFNPMRLPRGMEPSDDEILRVRGEVYTLGCHERQGIGCPWHNNRGGQG